MGKQRLECRLQAKYNEQGIITDLLVASWDAEAVDECVQVWGMITPTSYKGFKRRFLERAHYKGQRTPTLHSIRKHLQIPSFSLRKLYLELIQNKVLKKGNDVCSRIVVRSKQTGKIVEPIMWIKEPRAPGYLTLQGRHRQQQQALYTLLREAYPQAAPARHYMYIALLYPMNYALWHQGHTLCFMHRDGNCHPRYRELFQMNEPKFFSGSIQTDMSVLMDSLFFEKEGYKEEWRNEDFGIQQGSIPPSLWQTWGTALQNMQEESKEEDSTFNYQKYLPYELELLPFLRAIDRTSLVRLYKHLLVVLADLFKQSSTERKIWRVNAADCFSMMKKGSDRHPRLPSHLFLLYSDYRNLLKSVIHN